MGLRISTKFVCRDSLQQTLNNAILYTNFLGANRSLEQTKGSENALPIHAACNTTSRHLKSLLKGYMHNVSVKCKQQPQLVLAAWSKVLDAPFSTMTKAVRFDEGTLHVHVSNSTLLSILNRAPDRQRLLKALQDAVPGVQIRAISFRIG